MKRQVNRTPIDAWVKKHKPQGIEKLASKSGVSSSLISKIRVGRVPVKNLYRQALAKALGVKEDELFPATEGKAS